jgi:tetratricopeptide (TPR) repeat protein
MQERRVADRRKPDSPKKAPILPFAILGAIVGLVAGFFLARAVDIGSVRVSESPFGPEAGRHIAKGRDFSGVSDLKDLPAADRERFAKSVKLAEAGSAPQALDELAQLRKQHPDFCPAHGLSALIRMGAINPGSLETPAPPAAVPPRPASPDQDITEGAAPQDPATEAAGGVEAQREWQTCLAQDTAHPWVQYVAGRWFERSGRPDSAEAHYRKAIQSAPHFAYPYIALGRVQLAQGDMRTANKNFRSAIGLMESSPEDYRPGKRLAIPVTEIVPYDLLATLYYQTGAEDSARMALEYGEEKGVHTDRMSLVQGWLWEARGFLPKADSLYRALQAKDPANPAYAEALATLGWKPQSRASADGATGPRPADTEAIFAISLLDPLARQHTKNAPLWMALGQAYFRRGMFGIATECFDSSLKYDATLPGVGEKRDAAYQALIRQTVPAKSAARAVAKSADALAPDEQVPVVIPGSIALLGTYSVPWGSTQTQVRSAYPRKTFQTLPNGNLRDTFLQEGLRHDYLLAFKAGRLWGVRVLVTDSAGNTGDVFGRTIRTKAKISGEGKGTGEAKCAGFKSFQGAIWENDDTFEFMAQFENETNRVRLARIGREYLPQNRRLCDLVNFLREDAWK